MDEAEKKRIRTMDVILIVIAVFLLIFISLLLWMYYRTGGIPDTLCTCVFGVCGGECGVMGLSLIHIFVVLASACPAITCASCNGMPLLAALVIAVLRYL